MVGGRTPTNDDADDADDADDCDNDHDECRDDDELRYAHENIGSPHFEAFPTFPL
jgi:hypothetical protein